MFAGRAGLLWCLLTIEQAIRKAFKLKDFMKENLYNKIHDSIREVVQQIKEIMNDVYHKPLFEALTVNEMSSKCGISVNKTKS
jgi:thermostable 8-oxoguanine DNA glycosylase